MNEIKSVDVVATGTRHFRRDDERQRGLLREPQPGERDGRQRSDGSRRSDNLTDARSDSDPVIVAGGNAILEGGDGGIGSSSNPLFVALSAGSLTASASDDVYITETQYDIRVADVYSNSDVYLTTPGSIIDAYPDDDQPEWEIGAHSATLQAGEGIGTGTNYVGTLLSGGTITAHASKAIFLHQFSGDMDVSLVKSTSGDVALWADGSILDSSLGVGPVVIGNNITLRSDNAAIGSGTAPLAIESAYSGPGTLTSSSYLNTYVTETSGNLSLDTIETAEGTAFISAPGGEILNGNPGGTNILSGATYLFAYGDIGEQTNQIISATPSTVSAAELQGISQTGSIWISNTGSLDVAPISGSGDSSSIDAGGSVQLTDHCITTLEGTITVGGTVPGSFGVDETGGTRATTSW